MKKISELLTPNMISKKGKIPVFQTSTLFHVPTNIEFASFYSILKEGEKKLLETIWKSKK
jgi:hypothetical protein